MSFTPSNKSHSRMTPAKTPRSWGQVFGIMPSTKKRRTETVEPGRDDGMSSNAPVVVDLLSGQLSSMTPRSNGKKRVPQMDFSKGDPKEQALAEQRRLAADKDTSLTIYSSTAPSSALAQKSRRDGPQFSLGSKDLSRKSAMSRKMRYRPNARGLIGNRSVGATYQRRNNAVDIPTLKSVLSTLEPSFTQDKSQALKTVKSIPGKVQYGNSQRLSRLPKPSEKSSQTRTRQQQQMAISNQTDEQHGDEDQKQRKKVQFQSSTEDVAVVSFVPTTPATSKGYGSRLPQRQGTPMPNGIRIGTSETIDSVDYHDDDADNEEIATPSSTASMLLMTKPEDFVLNLDGPYEWTAEIKPFDLSTQEPLRDDVQFKWTSDAFSQAPLPTGDLESFEAGKYDESAVSPKKPKPKVTPKRASPKEPEPAEQSAKRSKHAGSPGKPSMKPEDAQPLGWGNIFKDQFKGKWQCKFCCVYNSEDLDACMSCESPGPQTTTSKKSSGTETKKSDSSSKPPKKATSQFVFGAPTPSLPVPTGKPVEDKFSFGSSLPPASNSPAPKFMFGSIPSSTKDEPSKPTTTLLGSSTKGSAPPAGGFVFGGTKTAASSSTASAPANEADKPTFSFGSVEKAKEEKKQTFSFGAQSTPVTPAPAPSTTAISFEKKTPATAEPASKPSFGSFAEKPAETKGEKAAFSFGSQQNKETNSFKPSFSFGSNTKDNKTAPPSFGSSSAPVAPKLPQNEASGGKGAFSAGKPDAGSTTFAAPTAPTAAPPILFGKKPEDPPATAPAFSFGASPAGTPAPAISKSSTPSISAPSGGFSFGGAQTTTANTSNGGALGSFTKPTDSTDGASRAKRSRGGASNGESDQSTSTGFGGSTIQGTSFGVSAPSPAFAFGQPSTQGQEKTGSTPAFSFGASGASAPPSTPAPAPPVPAPTPAATFQFGAATTATPAFSAPPTGSQPGFTFGQSASQAPSGASQNPAPSIQFGQSSAAVAAPNPFGGTPAPMGSAAPQQQTFFGGPPNAATTPAPPAFGAGGGFGAAPPMTAPPASSGFGGPAAGGFNSMLPGSSNTPMVPGAFGNSASTPGAGGFGFGSQAASGVGGFPPVANQTPLQAAPSQVPGFGGANSAGFGANPAANPTAGGGFNIGSSTGRAKRNPRRIIRAKRPGV